MKNLVYKNYNTFNEELLKLAETHSKALTFITRDEYLIWVKQWKEDYKTVLQLHTIEKFTRRRDRSTLQEKIDRFQKILDKIPNLSDEQKARIEVLKKEFLSLWGLNSYTYCSHYLLWHMYVVRKAGKIRAGQQRELRINPPITA